jgi:hypothetical protein
LAAEKAQGGEGNLADSAGESRAAIEGSRWRIAGRGGGLPRRRGEGRAAGRGNGRDGHARAARGARGMTRTSIEAAEELAGARKSGGAGTTRRWCHGRARQCKQGMKNGARGTGRYGSGSRSSGTCSPWSIDGGKGDLGGDGSMAAVRVFPRGDRTAWRRRGLDREGTGAAGGSL